MNNGFSLIETLVIISIIGIMSSLSLVALPAARAHQQLIADTELIKSLVLDSKQRALNQVRPADCLRDVPPDSEERAGCSDVGIVFKVNGSVTQFADKNKNGTYNPSDHTIVVHKLSTVATPNNFFILFKSVPPSVETHANGAVMGPQDKAEIRLTASNGETRKLVLQQFGTMDVAP